MPELPEVETIRRALINVQGAKIIAYQQSAKTMRINFPPQRQVLANKIIGQKIRLVGRRGKNMLWFLDDGILLIHLGMSGKINWREVNSNAPKHEHWQIKFNKIKNNNQILSFVDARRFGGIAYFNNYEEVENYLHHGPEPLLNILPNEIAQNINSNKFDKKYLFAKTRKSNKPIKVWLMEVNNVAGVGNIYASEALFLARVSPKRIVSSLSQNECKNIILAVQTVLTKAIDFGGSTLRDYKKVDGESGGFQDEFSVYGQKDKACKICKKPIIQIVQAGRASYYCGKCQK